MLTIGAEDMALRPGIATLLGMALGFDREWHGHDAGLRTHALVALSSAMLTISALLLFADLRGAGLIFVRAGGGQEPDHRRQSGDGRDDRHRCRGGAICAGRSGGYWRSPF